MNNLERGAKQLDKLISKSVSNSANKEEIVVGNTSKSSTPTNQSYDDAVKELAKLKPFEYDRVRREKAKALGVQIKTLDADVKALRNDENESECLPFPEVEPYPNPISPAQLLNEISEIIRKFIVLDAEQADAIALWVVFTWLIDEVKIAPLMIISAPERACGKSQLLSLLGKLVCRPLTTNNMRAATLFRIAEKWHPAILIDEADTFIKADEELAGLINAGHSRDSAVAWRLVGNNFEPKGFNVWGAKAFAGISLEKHLPEATISRAIVINLRRKLPHESVGRLRHAESGVFEELSAKLSRFAEDYSQQIRNARPTLPEKLSDRAQDNWEPLLAIAKCAGVEWVHRATKAALKLSGTGEKLVSTSNELLADIQLVFKSKKLDKVSTIDLISALCEDDERPWLTYNRGKPISPRQIASRLAGYEIRSKTIRLRCETAKGFERSQFDDVFKRYLAYPQNLPSQSNNSLEANNDTSFDVTGTKNYAMVLSAKVTQETAPNKDCDVVTDKTGCTKTIHPEPSHLRI